MSRVPSLRRHKPSGRAFVELNGKRHYVGKWGTAGAEAAYHRRLAEHFSSASGMPDPTAEAVTIKQVCAGHWLWAQRHFIKDGKQTKHVRHIRLAIASLVKLYGAVDASKFGPLALAAIQQSLVDGGTLSRQSINQRVKQVRAIFKWATARELVPAMVYHGLLAVEPLRRGRTTAHENRTVEPIDPERVAATLPFLPATVRDMVQLLALCGCRPGELCRMKPREVDCSGDVWRFRPTEHKTSHLGRDRTIYFGPRAQSILGQYLRRPADEPCFSPAESEANRRAELTANRKTPLSCGNRVGTNRKRRNARKLRTEYTAEAVHKAIRQGCERAFGMPTELRKKPKGETQEARRERLDAAKEWRRKFCWNPYRLRHLAGTQARKAFGLEGAQVFLGHSRADVTQIYAERDSGLGERIAREAG